jgi:hypothetical protein
MGGREDQKNASDNIRECGTGKGIRVGEGLIF